MFLNEQLSSSSAPRKAADLVYNLAMRGLILALFVKMVYGVSIEDHKLSFTLGQL